MEEAPTDQTPDPPQEEVKEEAPPAAETVETVEALPEPETVPEDVEKEVLESEVAEVPADGVEVEVGTEPEAEAAAEEEEVVKEEEPTKAEVEAAVEDTAATEVPAVEVEEDVRVAAPSEEEPKVDQEGEEKVIEEVKSDVGDE